MIELKCPSCGKKTKTLKKWKFIELKVSRHLCGCGKSFIIYKGKGVNKIFQKLSDNDTVYQIDENNIIKNVL